MKTSKTNPILNFRLGNETCAAKDVEELDLINGLSKNWISNLLNLPGGSFITLTRETADNTESSG